MADLTIEQIENVYPQKSDYANGIVIYGPDNKTRKIYTVDCKSREIISVEDPK